MSALFPRFSSHPALPRSAARRDTSLPSRQTYRAAPAARAHDCARAHSHAERSTANPELQPARTPHALQEVEPFSWLPFGEAYSALRGWRPIPAALPSQSVLPCSGTEDFPSNRTIPAETPETAPYCTGRTSPDKKRSIRKTTCSVKSDPQKIGGNRCGKRLCRLGCHRAGPQNRSPGRQAILTLYKLQITIDLLEHPRLVSAFHRLHGMPGQRPAAALHHSIAVSNHQFHIPQII